MVTVQKAQVEWIEYSQAYKDSEKMSTEETAANQTQEDRSGGCRVD